MSENFVGFAQSPKGDPRRKLTKQKFEVELSADLREVLGSFATAELYSELLDKSVRFDFRQGGKLIFEGAEEYRGTFSQIAIPRSIVLNTELHGEISFSFRALKTGSRVVVALRRAVLPEESDQWNLACQKLERNLRVVFS